MAAAPDVMDVRTDARDPAKCTEDNSMGDAGEGLIDADAKIQERMEELQLARAQARRPAVRNPDQVRAVESLKLARTDMARQLEATTHEGRRAQITQAIATLDEQIKDAEKALQE
jgi:hypothetical protein